MNGKLWNENDVRTVLLAALFGSICVIGLSALLAAMVLGGVFDQNTTGLLAWCACLAGVFLGGLLAARHAKKRKLIASLAVAGAMGAAFALARLLFWGSEPVSIWPQLLCICAAALVSGLLGSQKKKRPRRRRH